MLDHISLKSYRNLNLETDISKAGNIIIAPNGSGKSNFLESIYFANMGKSYKPMHHRREIISHSEDFARLQLVYGTESLETVISETDRLQVKFTLNNKRKPISEIIGRFPVIIFAPHSVDLVSSDPASRREDIDDFLSLMSAQYNEAITRYRKIVKNRNALLKNIRDHQSERDQLRFWTAEIVKLAHLLYAHRLNYFDEVTPFLTDSADKIYGNGKEFRLRYEPNSVSELVSPEQYSQILQEKFSNNEDKEIIVGQTLYGPHKDDYTIFLDDENLRFLGSRGQQRLSIFIWKLAQHEYFKSKKGDYPLLLIDDLMSELDVEHRNLSADFIVAQEWQYILTSADTKEVPEQLKEKATNIVLRD